MEYEEKKLRWGQKPIQLAIAHSISLDELIALNPSVDMANPPPDVKLRVPKRS